MLSSVFFDLRYFLLLYSIFLYAFSLLLSVLVGGYQDDYDGLGDGMSFFMIALRTAFGDNEMDDYAKKSYYKTLAWVIWLVIILVGHVVFMNFIIAVVNESYENCMTKMVAQCFKVKVEMIIEREDSMSEADLNDPEWFPRYLILRRMAGSDDGSSSTHQWQGMVKEIKMSA